MLATPNDTFRFKQVMKYYVSHYDSLQGEILDWQSWSTNAGIVDFSGQSTAMFGAEVNHNSNGDWEIKYHSQISWSNLMLRAGATRNIGLIGGDANFAVDQDRLAQLQSEMFVAPSFLDIPQRV
jgi:hypothetical protein